jgi:hypothetical protein
MYFASILFSWLGTAAIVVGIGMMQPSLAANDCNGCTVNCYGPLCLDGTCTGTSKCDSNCACVLTAAMACTCG